jgi:hypothetical protein
MKWLLLATLLPIACAEQPTFDPPSHIDSVRILATRADSPYARPGDHVEVEVLAVDGRSTAPEPMHVYFLPRACINPPNDAYYGCFSEFRAEFPSGVDLESELLSGTTFSFDLPADVIDAHAGIPGQTPYGMVVDFAIACAGRVEYRPDLAGAAPDAVPFACFDRSDRQLGAEEFAFAYSLVYAFSDRSNANPLLESLTFGGTPVDPSAGIEVDHCTASNIDDCPATKLDVNVPSSSQEPDPSNSAPDGAILGESLYVNYFSTAGKIANDTTIIFDPRQGRLADTGNDFRSPPSAGDYQLWAVVHDNRGGVVGQQFRLHVR